MDSTLIGAGGRGVIEERLFSPCSAGLACYSGKVMLEVGSTPGAAGNHGTIQMSTLSRNKGEKGGPGKTLAGLCRRLTQPAPSIGAVEGWVGDGWSHLAETLTAPLPVDEPVGAEGNGRVPREAGEVMRRLKEVELREAGIRRREEELKLREALLEERELCLREGETLLLERSQEIMEARTEIAQIREDLKSCPSRPGR